MNKIESLKNNIEVMNIAMSTFDFSCISNKEALGIIKGFEYIRDYCKICIDFENGFDPDKN